MNEDARLLYILKKISQAYKVISIDKVNDFINNEITRRKIFDFIENLDNFSVFIKETKGLFEIIDAPIRDNKSTLFYIIKLNKSPLSEENISNEIIYGDITMDPLDHLVAISQRIYNPIITNKSITSVWSDNVAKDIREHFESFIANIQITAGNVKGITCLPLPNDVSSYDDSSTSNGSIDYISRVHDLETAIISWTKQIKNVLKQDTESVNITKGNMRPGPMVEVEYWRLKSINLNGIFDQLQSPNVRRILKVLDVSKSTYNIPFAKLCKDVFYSRNEANNIIKYLIPFSNYLVEYEYCNDYESLPNHFYPIMSILLIIWKKSTYYNTTIRLTNMLRLISNTLINHSFNYLNGDLIFEYIDNQNMYSLIKILLNIIKIIEKYKSIYFIYENKSYIECPNNPWKIQHNAIFYLLDKYIERCYDVYEMVNTILQYNKLSKIEIGGTKGKTLTNIILSIYSDFNELITTIRNTNSNDESSNSVRSSGILDIDNKLYDNLFYDFRLRMKELDKRLSSVIIQGFDDTPTVNGRFRLLDIFDNLINRTIISDSLEKKHGILIESIYADVLQVEYLYNIYKENPPIPPNLPPISGALTWCRGLLERIQIPIDRLKLFDSIIDREDTKEVLKLYLNLSNHLNEYNNEKIDTWGKSIESSSQSKLKNPLLRREVILSRLNSSASTTTNKANSSMSPSIYFSNPITTISNVNLNGYSNSVGLLYVNFDPLLIRLLREVKYFLLLGLEVPESAMEIYKQGELYRRYVGNLELIVNMYNDIQNTLLPVERPLVKSNLDHIDKTLSQGLGDGVKNILSSPMNNTNKASDRGMVLSPSNSNSVTKTPNNIVTKGLNWKSNNIDNFISDVMIEVRESIDIIETLKGSLYRIEQIVLSWQAQPMFERGSKCLLLEEFNQLQNKTKQTKIVLIKESSQEIHRLIKDINKKLKVSQGLPDWKGYIDFLNNVIINGLIDTVRISFNTLALQLDSKYQESNGLPALLEIQLDIKDKKISFVPEIELFTNINNTVALAITNSLSTKNISNSNLTINVILNNWMSSMMTIGGVFKRLDTNEGSFFHEIADATSLIRLRSKILQNLNITMNKCENIRKLFFKYEYLWLNNIESNFQAFLSETIQYEKILFEDDDDKDNIDTNNPTSNPSNSITSPTGSIANKADKDFENYEKTKQNTNYWTKTNINLNLFHDKITNLLDLQTEIVELKSIYEIDFLKINVVPLKQSMLIYLSKWINIYTQYLIDYMYNHLVNINQFFKDINKGLDKPIDNQIDRDTLMTIMTHIRDVRKRLPEISSLFVPLRSIVVLLKTKNIPIDTPLINNISSLDFLDSCKMQLDNLVNKTYRIKEIIKPIKNNFIEVIKKEIKLYENSLLKFSKDLNNNGPYSFTENYSINKVDVYIVIDKYFNQLNALKQKQVTINELQDLFELPLSNIAIINELENLLVNLKNIWDIYYLIEHLFISWKSTLWADINTDTLLDEVKLLDSQLKKQVSQVKAWPIYKRLESSVVNMMKVLPLVHELHSLAMRDRHWKQLFVLTLSNSNNSNTNNNISINISNYEKGPSFCLNDLLLLNLHLYIESVNDIIDIANKELKIENRLNLIELNWNSYQFHFDRHRDTEVYIITQPDDILESLEENHLHLQSMNSMGKYVEYFYEKVIQWQLLLGEIENTLKLLLIVTKQWGSLESIFLGSIDIRAQLPDDTKRFESIDNEFKELMRDIVNNPYVIKACTVDGREMILRNMFKELEKCEKALNEYLEIKKRSFARFYFVSNTALLDILSNGNNPPKILPYLGAIFDGINELELCLTSQQIKLLSDDPDNYTNSPKNAAKSMISKDNEVVQFTKIFEMKNNPVEYWLVDLVKCMQNTLKDILSTSMAETSQWIDEGSREEWIFTVPAQIALVTSQIMWTDEVETALEELEGGQEDSLKKYNEISTTRLEGLIKLVQGDLSKGDRVKIITLITIDVHNRDIVTSFVQKKVESNIDFKWQSQLRYYWGHDDKNVTIRICDFVTLYSFEYIGNCGRLVITPLTDRCYVTLTTALRLTLGGAPAGPAGTGKTETTKDLARGLGLPCYVFNCSDQMNYQTMGDIFKGLAQVGAWGCFDEFNRIEIEVLSVVASQVRCILDAIIYLSVPSHRPQQFQHLPAGNPPVKVGTFDFFDDQISLVPTVGLFITMNPGYAGRTELPENLKALFRSCAMVQPDLLPICENMLMAEGFVKARPLSIKFVTLYRLSSELLSKQHHYDWGLRAIKSVLRIAGLLKRSDPTFSEEAVLMRALRDFNTPKIPTNDIPIFLRLINDLFPGLDLLPKVNESLYNICVDVCKANSIQSDDIFISKVLQYQELLDVRHSVMLLGPPGCGKSMIWKTLSNCHNFNKSKPITVYDVVNPKAVTTDELYGYMTLTKDWRDGVLSIIMRNMSSNSSPYSATQTSKWVVLDGDIDAIWIESMNTVMDDNKVLTLVSNERIPLTESMRMIFEIHSLRHATPATVSRAGILYINDTDIGYQPYVDSWLSNRNNADQERHFLLDSFDRYLHKVIEFFSSNKLETIVKLPLINLIQSLCYLLDGMLKLYSDKSQLVIERIFLYCLIWSFGGALAAEKQLVDYRKLFSVYFKGLARIIKYPEIGSVFDYFIDPLTGDIISWQSKIANNNNNVIDHMGHANILVPTADSTRLRYLIDLLIRNSKPVMFIGSSGTGKTLLSTDYLHNLCTTSNGYQFVNINMNYYTDSLSLQLQLEQNIDKRSGKTYGPPNGKLIYFIDDLNLPLVEKYGTQTPIALIRQHIDYGSWFDRTDMGLKKFIIDCQYVACMNHKSGSFEIDPRLQRHFVTFACTLPNEADLMTIFSTILDNHIFHRLDFNKKIQNISKYLIDATINLHKEISNKFLPSAVKFHYNFTMRDITSVVKGLLNSKPKYYKNPSDMIRLWYHESMRVYSDRLLTENEIQRCRDTIMNIGKKYIIDESIDTAVVDKAFIEPCTFTHFISSSLDINASMMMNTDNATNYLPCEDTNKLRKEINNYLYMYNESHTIMNLVLFDQALRHITRIARILQSPYGNALLVGIGGSGKQSLSKLSSYICQFDVVQLSISSEYNINDFKESLKDMYRKTAVKPCTPLVFILTDTQIINERFLIYINDYLSTGYIPDLFTKEEYDGIFNSIRNAAKSEGIADNRDAMMSFFIDKVRTNLHVILCFSPVGDLFRQRCRKFPSLINCTSINWFHEWPKDALVSVAQKFLEDIDLNMSLVSSSNSVINSAPNSNTIGTSSNQVRSPNSVKRNSTPNVNNTIPNASKQLDTNILRDNLAYHIAEVHASVGLISEEYYVEERRYNYVTPKSFLELINFYKTLLKLRKDELIENISRLETGLDTLMRTNKDVSRLQDFLKDKKKEVEIKKQASEVLLEEMGKQRSEAESQQLLADAEKLKADNMAEEARKLEEQAAVDLAEATPAMEKARDSVDCLDKASMTELKSFTKPPAGLDKVTTALLIMIKFEKKDFSWDNAKKMMAKVDSFKEKLETYNGKEIPEDVITRVTPFLDDPDFNYERMKTKSLAAANLVNWVVNILEFNKIYKRVKPLMDSLEIATKSKRKAEEDLAIVNDKITVIESKLHNLQTQFTFAMQEKAKVESEYKDCLDRLSLAERLTNGLSSEKERWSQTISKLRSEAVTLPGDVMLAAAFTSYIGAFSYTFRQKLWKNIWLQDIISRDIPITANIDPLYILTNESQIASWQNENLPSDRMSTENGAIITNCNRWPLLIDPQLQGIKWLKKYELSRVNKNSKHLIIIRQNEKGFMTKIVNAISAGDTVIIENINETIDASLNSLLSKSLYKKNKVLYIKIGDDDVEYDENFRLYLQTKLSNPHYKPEISAQCTLINFIVTKIGLEEQLLATIVSEEEPELERNRNLLIQSFNNYKIQLKELEDNLLERLANAPVDILSDIPLIEGLEATKIKASDINDAVIKGKKTEVGINQTREIYRIIASEASLFYFLLLSLNSIDHMYQYSLDSFNYFFIKALKNYPTNTDKVEKLKNLQNYLRWILYKWIIRGLFEKHKLIFLTQLTFLLIQNNIINNLDIGYNDIGYQFLLLGFRSLNNSDEKSPISWIQDDDIWNGIKTLSASIEGFEKLPSDMEENSNRFLEWYTHFTPETEKLPGEWKELDKHSFKKLLLIRILRPDRITMALTNFIRDVLPLGKSYIDCDTELNSYNILEQSYLDSKSNIPIYFILSPGADVVSDVDKLAIKYNKTKGIDYHNISLGQGQDIVATERLDVGNRQGHWIFLNNIHLMPKWLTLLEKKLDEYNNNISSSHEDFRIFLSSDPSTYIPISILDRSIKITSDPPSGLKANLKQAVACFTKEFYEELEPRSRGILFGLCQFHAIMVERKKFGMKGFNMMYPFNLGDLICSSLVLKNYMESAPAKVPWTDLRYIFGEIMYGGHIVNNLDRLLCSAYLDFYMKDELLDEMILYPYLDFNLHNSNQSNNKSNNSSNTNNESNDSGNMLFRSPPVSYSYDSIVQHIDDNLKYDTPIAFGLHPNTEIDFRTSISENLLHTLYDLSNSSTMATTKQSNQSNSDSNSNSNSNSNNMTQNINETIQIINELLRDKKFDLMSIYQSNEDIGPFQNVVLQECERMNYLLDVILKSCNELDLGLRGELTISESMDKLSNDLYLYRIPNIWEQASYPSLRPLNSWLDDLNNRITQLSNWKDNGMPVVTWISGLFNPQSFITCVMQMTAQLNGYELDKLILQTDITKKLTAEEMTIPLKDGLGAYIYGLSLEGGTWNISQGLLETSKPREMYCHMPVIQIRPVMQSSETTLGQGQIYQCPVFKTKQRGPTYVFSIQLKTKYDPAKWILAGVVAVLDIV